MSLLVECLTEQKCFHIRFKSSKLSATVRGREFQVAGAEQRKARLPKAVLEKGSERMLLMLIAIVAVWYSAGLAIRRLQVRISAGATSH